MERTHLKRSVSTPERLLRNLASPLKKRLGRKQMFDAIALLVIWPELVRRHEVSVAPGGAVDERRQTGALAQACQEVGQELGGVSEVGYNWLAEQLLRSCTGEEREHIQTALKGATGAQWGTEAIANALLEQRLTRQSSAVGYADIIHAALSDSAGEIAIVGSYCASFLSVLAGKHGKYGHGDSGLPLTRLIITDDELADLENVKGQMESTATGLAIALALLTHTRMERYSSLAEALFAAYSSDAFVGLLTEPPQRLSTESFAQLADEYGYSIEDINPLEQEPEKTRAQAYLLVPSRLFHHPASYALRQQAVDLGLLRAVVQLPEHSLPALKNPHLLIFNYERCPDQEVLFLDGSVIEASRHRQRENDTAADWQRLGELIKQHRPGDEKIPGALVRREAELRYNKYDYSVQLYARGPAQVRMESLQSERRTQPLKAVAELIRGQSLTDLAAEGSSVKEPTAADNAYTFREFAPAHMTESGLIEPATLAWDQLRCVSVTSPKALHRAWSQQLQCGDILLTIKGKPGTVAYVEELPETAEPIVANQSFLVIRLEPPKHTALSAAEPSLTSVYLFHYLASSLVQEYFAEVARGSALPLIRAADIHDLPIPQPTQQEIEEIHNHHVTIRERHRQIRELHEAIAADRIDLERRHWLIRDS
ncbi:hypothetical protein [Halorhodospira halochloris]|uniref:hypothetical protein n=1 Tax=Halorhodospira halochloris TaxID=1052 RepID=UPI001EE7BFE1|nr:hypothetical protein [Halorhodospira halochloris]MCG5549218.1 hypothetical protein [Halorhodospira halochloris]